jgi:hypothetical protein
MTRDCAFGGITEIAYKQKQFALTIGHDAFRNGDHLCLPPRFVSRVSLEGFTHNPGLSGFICGWHCSRRLVRVLIGSQDNHVIPDTLNRYAPAKR